MDTPLKTKNIQLLLKQNPFLGNLLARYSVKQEQIKLCRTAGERNLQVLGNSCFYVHEPKSPKEEATQWFKQLAFDNCDVLFIFGLGLGYYYEGLKSWLEENPNRFINFIEPDLNVLSIFLDTKLATKILKDKQVEIHHLPENEKEQTEFIYILVQENILSPSLLCALKSYEKEYTAEYMSLLRQINFEKAEQGIYVQEMSNFGFPFFNNFYRNLFQLPSAYNGNALFGKFTNIPAIICGAGSSLLKDINLLKELKDKALIFGSGSAMNVLNAHDIIPHFGVNIDPTPDTFHRVVMQRAFEVPFFYRNRIYYEALETIHGPHLYLQGVGLYDIAEWFEKQLGIDSVPIGEGYNVIHASLHIAHRLGCNPIIFLGVDNSFTDRHYAMGIETHPLFPSSNLDHKPHLGPTITLKDLKGNTVKSYWPWIIESHWCDQFHRDHPKIKIINASDGGIGLFSIPNKKLEEVAKQNLTKSFDLQSLIHQTIQAGGFVNTSLERIVEVVQTFKDSLKKCEIFCQQFLSSGKMPSKKFFQEVGYKYLLAGFNGFFSKMTQRERTYIIREESEKKKIKLRNELEKKRFVYLSQAIQLNIKLIEVALEERKKILTDKPKTKNNIVPSECKGTPLYYPNGALFSLKDEEKQLYYFPDGTLKSSLSYKQDQLDGEVQLFYPNGQIKHLYHFVKGKRNGIEKSWYENGQLFTEVEYKDNKPLRARVWNWDGVLVKEAL